ncbi:MAG: hypothetical protein H6684_10205 [Deltaproteobacteria bacterium]|nr:hypothetical protein [Deltaproteobacteria bacterium]
MYPRASGDLDSPRKPLRRALFFALGFLGAFAIGYYVYRYLDGKPLRSANTILSIFGLAILPAFWWADRGRHGRLTAVLTFALATMTIAGVLTNMERHIFHDRRPMYWNAFHYILATKYFDEVGYFDLYRAAALADDEMNKVFQANNGTIRDMRLYKRVPIRRQIDEARRDGLKDRFTPERWEEFKRDLDSMLIKRSAKFWGGPINDRGFNPSPAWLVLHRPLLNVYPFHKEWGIKDLTDASSWMLLAVVVAFWWALGLRYALFATLWFTVYFGNYGKILGTYFGYDWFVYFAFFFALAAKGWWKSGAPFLAYSGMMRGFTGMAAFPAAFRWLWDAVRHRAIPRQGTGYLVAVGVCCVLLLGLGSMTQRGTGAWSEWIEKISVHSEHHPTGVKRIGLKYLFANEYTSGKWEDSHRVMKRRLKETKPVYRAVSFTLIALTLLAAIRRDPLDATILFLPLVFFSLVISRYYLSVGVVLLAWRSLDRGHGLGQLASAMWVFAIPVFYYLYNPGVDTARRTWWWVNVMLLVYCVAVVANFLVRDAADLYRAAKLSGEAPEQSDDEDLAVAA